MPSYFASGLVKGVEPFAKALTDEQFKKRERKQKAEEAPGQAVSFVEALKQAGIPIEQLSSVNPQEGTVGFRQPGTDLSTMIAMMASGGLGQGGIGGQQGSQEVVQPLTKDMTGAIPKDEGLESTPVINKAVSGLRAVGRATGFRPVEAGITSSLKARATPAIKALGEVGVLTDTDVERILGGGFPGDSDLNSERFVKRRGTLATLEEKEKVLVDTINREIPMTLSRVGSKGGASFVPDPSLMAARRKAQQDLVQLRQAKSLINQIFDEADRDMPAIGQKKSGEQPGTQQQSSESGGKILVRNKATGDKGMLSPKFFDETKYERL